MADIEQYQVNPGSWIVDGNVVTDQFDDPTLYNTFNATLFEIDSSEDGIKPPIGDTVIHVVTASQDVNEGLREEKAIVEVENGDSLWHSVYVQGSGIVIIQTVERDNLGNIVAVHSSNPLILSDEYQELDINTIITDGVLITFNVVTNNYQGIEFNVNGVYVNKGDSPRTGQNLASPNIANTGADGSLDGFIKLPSPGNGSISVLPICNKLELRRIIPSG